MKKTKEIEVTKGQLLEIHNALRSIYNSQETGEGYSYYVSLSIARNIRATKDIARDVQDDILAIKKSSAKRDDSGSICYENGTPIVGDHDKFSQGMKAVLSQKVSVNLNLIKYTDIAKIASPNPNLIEPLLDIFIF